METPLQIPDLINSRKSKLAYSSFLPRTETFLRFFKDNINTCGAVVFPPFLSTFKIFLPSAQKGRGGSGERGGRKRRVDGKGLIYLLFKAA